ncbi:hypothetical protein [Ohtaekwangia sp.]|uniref:hypothetical protein n=1 Tax=Ohtaekwangia sp. TaxID=2066019 RepID=UPI002F9584AA
MTDVAITIRISSGEDEFSQSVAKVVVSEQDNSVASILQGSPLIKYTSIPFSLNAIMSEDERNYFYDFLPDEDDDQMQTISAVAPAAVAIAFFEKIRSHLIQQCPSYLLQDLENVEPVRQSAGEKERAKERIILDYLHLWDSLSQIVGVLKVANTTNSNVQLIMNHSQAFN